MGETMNIIKTVIISGFILLFFFETKAEPVDINLLKTAYIERITRFVEWPQNNITDTTTIVVGIFNDAEFAHKATEVYRIQHIRNHKVKVLLLNDQDEIANCHICYIHNIEPERLSMLIREANEKGILLFSDDEFAARSGVHINFYMENGKLKFEINESSVMAARFKISHLLMKSARII